MRWSLDFLCKDSALQNKFLCDRISDLAWFRLQHLLLEKCSISETIRTDTLVQLLTDILCNSCAWLRNGRCLHNIYVVITDSDNENSSLRHGTVLASLFLNSNRRGCLHGGPNCDAQWCLLHPLNYFECLIYNHTDWPMQNSNNHY